MAKREWKDGRVTKKDKPAGTDLTAGISPPELRRRPGHPYTRKYFDDGAYFADFDAVQWVLHKETQDEQLSRLKDAARWALQDATFRASHAPRKKTKNQTAIEAAWLKDVEDGRPDRARIKRVAAETRLRESTVTSAATALGLYKPQKRKHE